MKRMVLFAIGTPVLGAVILAALEPAWIDAIAGVAPDLSSGILEWVLVLVLVSVARGGLHQRTSSAHRGPVGVWSPYQPVPRSHSGADETTGRVRPGMAAVGLLAQAKGAFLGRERGERLPGLQLVPLALTSTGLTTIPEDCLQVLPARLVGQWPDHAPGGRGRTFGGPGHPIAHVTEPQTDP